MMRDGDLNEDVQLAASDHTGSYMRSEEDEADNTSAVEHGPQVPDHEA